MIDFIAALDLAKEAGQIDPKTADGLGTFGTNYINAARKAGKGKEAEQILDLYLDFVKKESAQPFEFEHFHKQVEPYRSFGLDYFRNVIDFDQSKVLGTENLDRIASQLEKGENVFLLANHQTEGDPQLIQLLIESTHPKVAEKMIFVAGHRVTTDPIAKPFSMGCNLLCIYSKKHIEHPPEERSNKLSHNQSTMKEMRYLLQEGGACIYIAPSGGRDRPIDDRYQPAPFDPPSLEMTLLQGRRVSTPTHYYPFTLLTHTLLPPPATVQRELGETRQVHHSPSFLFFGEEVDLGALPGEEISDKAERRKLRADFIWQKVYDDYQQLEALAPRQA
jgi:glycerol-3-phosphate O-acyltransferase